MPKTHWNSKIDHPAQRIQQYLHSLKNNNFTEEKWAIKWSQP